MDHVLKEAVHLGLLDGDYEREQTAQFLGMMQRFADLAPQKSKTEQVGQAVVRIIIEETNFENCSLVLWDQKNERLSLFAAFGLSDLFEIENQRLYNRSLTFAPGEGIAGRVFTSREPVFIEDDRGDLIPAKKDAVVQPSCLACIPLRDLGVLNISARCSHKFFPVLKRNWGVLSKFIVSLIVQHCVPDQSGIWTAPTKEAALHGDSSLQRNAADSPADDQLMHQLIDRIPQGICILDRAGKLMRINKGINKLQGAQANDVIGRSPSVFFHDPKVFQTIFEQLSALDQVECTDVSLVGATGDLYLADVYASRLMSAIGSLTGYLLVISDMTKKKALTEKMVRKEKLAALGTMAGGVAHDFNNLLMAILGNIQMILHETSDEETKRRLQNIEKAILDGAHTVRRLQKFTCRDREVQVAAVDIAEAINDVVDLTRPRWKNSMEKNGRVLDLQLDLERDCLADIHPSDLREVLTNIIFNAVEAMPNGGTLTLSSWSQNEWVIIEVVDTGIGVKNEVLTKIFDPFYTTKGVVNSGLGLSVSWSLVNRCGGEIQVTSKQGKGTTFSIKLPRSRHQKGTNKQNSLERNLDKYHILVIDDEIPVLEIVRDMLRLKGHRVAAVSDSIEALRLIEKESFDLVLTDLGMPVISGWQIAEKVKANSPGVPVILFTGWGAQFEENDLSRRGVDVVLTKPLSLEKLLITVDQTIASYRTVH
ncbi:MAG: response regulator [Desulforhabdus sp.]|jgi:PAS domain S-box-containing protein|nr:response regulator [Desulforhabdus sp.]